MSAEQARGHRSRLWTRLMKSGLRQGLPHTYEKLEFLLTLVLPRIDTKPLARALLNRFGSLNAVLGATPQQLQNVDGVGPRTAHFLHTLHELNIALEEEFLAKRSWLNHPQRVKTYVRGELAWLEAEHLLVLYLNTRGRLLHGERLLRGTVDRVPHYPRELAKEALSRNAAGVIIAHNHPSGVANPSQQDIQATAEIQAALKTVGITLHDHLVVGHETVTSMAESNLLPL